MGPAVGGVAARGGVQLAPGAGVRGAAGPAAPVQGARGGSGLGDEVREGEAAECDRDRKDACWLPAGVGCRLGQPPEGPRGGRAEWVAGPKREEGGLYRGGTPELAAPLGPAARWEKVRGRLGMVGPGVGTPLCDGEAFHAGVVRPEGERRAPMTPASVAAAAEMAGEGCAAAAVRLLLPAPDSERDRARRAGEGVP
jgi:hypothetical protein